MNDALKLDRQLFTYAKKLSKMFQIFITHIHINELEYLTKIEGSLYIKMF